MSNTDLVMIIGGVIAAVLGGVDITRTNGQSLSAWGVVVLGITFVVLALS